MKISILDGNAEYFRKANVSEKFIEKLIQEVAPRVEELTGWDCYLADLNVDLVSSNEQFWERNSKRFSDILGISSKPETPAGKKKLQEDKDHFQGVAATYEWLSGTITLSPYFFILYSYRGVDAMAVALGHELTHRCQYENNPDFYEKEIDLFKKVHGT